VHFPATQLLQHWLLLLQDALVALRHDPARVLPVGQQKLVVPEQTLPHVPQLDVVFSGVQTPLQQPWPAEQTLPQEPQFEVVFSGVQTPLQQPWPAAHATQVAPPVPQCCVVLVWHCAFASQHPLGHVAAVQTLTQLPFWHCVPAGQATQATPFEPQAWFVLPGRQVLPSQQPLPQLAGVHTHAPPWHSVPAGQARQATPPVPQA
jgi:hypothetical protein